MENASKALLMAGGMLLTIIIVGVLVMAWNNMSQIPKTQEEIKAAEELVAFNKKYESYAKDGIRGSDLVTVVNMAVNNNEKEENKDKPDMQINIYYTITTAIEQVVREYTLQGGKWKLTDTDYSSEVGAKDYKNSNLAEFKDFSKSVKSEISYSLNKTGPWYAEEDLTQDFKEKMSNNGKYYTKTNIGAEFRRKKFNCKDIKYHENGRISEIYYEERS